jgi:site-specific recombinase XerD
MTKRTKRPQSIGQKRPFTREQVQLIRVNLLAQTGTIGWRQMALFELAISTCLRASDLLRLTVGEVARQEKVPVMQKKTRRVVLAVVSGEAQAAVHALVEERNLGPKDRLFPFSREFYGQLVKDWARLAHLDPRHYSTHSMRRTKPAHIYRMTKNVRVAQELLGHTDLSHTGAYLGIGVDEAHEISEEHKL